MKTVVFMGDSITDAGRSWEDDGNKGYGYPTLVSAEIGLDYPGEYKFYNRGISGHRIVDLYARIKADLINLKPDVLSILIGVNDVWHELGWKNGVEAEKFFKIYSMYIEEIREALPDIKIMIFEPFILKGMATEERWDEFRSEVSIKAQKVREVAEKYDLLFIPMQERFDKATEEAPNDYWLGDGVHPTSAGHEILKRAWIEGFHKLEGK